jgi:hypothetical protein
MIEFSSVPEGGVYLLRAKKSRNIDSVFFLLSKKRYQREHDIIDSLGVSFKVYSVLNVQFASSTYGDSLQELTRKIALKNICDLNNYHSGFLCYLTEEVQRNGPVIAVIIQLHHPMRKISYWLLNDKCDVLNYECSAGISN